MSYKDFYTIMEISPNASQDDIQLAYRRLAQKYHPDVNADPSAEQRFKEIREAYEVLKDQQKRAVYDASHKLIKPYTWAWLSAKKDKWLRNRAQIHARKLASNRASAQSRHQNVYPLLLLGISLLLGLAIGIVVMIWHNYSENQQRVIADLENETGGMAKLENPEVNAQKQLLKQPEARKMLVNFYLTHHSKEVIPRLAMLDSNIQKEIFADATIKTLLTTHYQNQIRQELAADNFTQAATLSRTIQTIYPDAVTFTDQDKIIQTQRNQRLSNLSQRYTDCVAPQHPLLENTPCIIEVRQRIAQIDPQHAVLQDPQLPKLYAQAIKESLTNKAYGQAEQLLSAWQLLLPQADVQRDALQQALVQQQQRENIIAGFNSGEANKIAESIRQLHNVETTTQAEIVQIPTVKNLLLNYHMTQVLTLLDISHSETEVAAYLNKIRPIHISNSQATGSKKVVSQDSVKSTPPNPNLINNEVEKLVVTCEKRYRNDLVKGKVQAAFQCYQAVLAKNSTHARALLGLQRIERDFIRWIEKALADGRVERAKQYLTSLERFYPRSGAIPRLKQRLQATQSSQLTHSAKKPALVGQNNEKTKIAACKECNCSELLNQLSLGTPPLTNEQQNFLQTVCR